MQVTVFKSTDGQFFESFDAYKAHEEAIQIKAKLADAELNLSAVKQDDRENQVIFLEDVIAFLADNATVLRDVLTASVVQQRKPRGPNKPKAAAEVPAA